MEVKEIEPLRIKEETGDTVEVYISKESTPFAWMRKMYELVHKAGMSEEEAERYLNTTPICLELFYDTGRGLFGVEEEAGECTEIYNPYTGEEIPNDNLYYKREQTSL